MPWQDRIREATYTSAAGVTLRFDFEDVSRELDLRGSAYTFPSRDGTYVQRTGVSGRRFPMVVFFWGDDHDEEAAAFDELLRQPGLGRLAHPFYGLVDVVPFGSVTQRDDLKTAANQTVLELTFWETSDLLYPTGQADPAAAVALSAEEFTISAAEEFAQSLGIDTAALRANVANTFGSLLDTCTDALGPVITGASDLYAQAGDIYSQATSVVGDVYSQFNAVAVSIENGLDGLIAGPSTLARQLGLLIQLPSRVTSRSGLRLSSFSSLIASIVGAGDPPRSYDARQANTVRIRDLYATSYVVAAAASAVNTRFDSKPAALQAAAAVLGMLDTVTEWRDQQYALLGDAAVAAPLPGAQASAATVGATDTGQAYQGMVDTVLLTAGYLVQVSFTLKQERRIKLDRARTIIDLTAELYGTVDADIDLLISSNNLTGSEILELPRGREIVYYS